MISHWDFTIYCCLPFALFPHSLKEIIAPTARHCSKLDSKEDGVSLVHSPVFSLGWDSANEMHHSQCWASCSIFYFLATLARPAVVTVTFPEHFSKLKIEAFLFSFHIHRSSGTSHSLNNVFWGSRCILVHSYVYGRQRSPQVSVLGGHPPWLLRWVSLRPRLTD